MNTIIIYEIVVLLISPNTRGMFAHVVCSVEEEMYKEWLAQVDEACKFNLAQALLHRNIENNLISVNFDPQVIQNLHVNCAQCLYSTAPSGGH